MSKPLLTLAELHVLLDAASGSLSIADRLGIYKYSTDTRKGVIDAIVDRMNHVALHVEELSIPEVQGEVEVVG